jgi:bifunctional enzyme CysN/CysC
MRGLDPGTSSVEDYLASQERKDLLRFITCGSVDDGKSTLIGRLLYESKMIFEDHLAALEADSKRVGTQGGDLDFALLVDGLAAEREQGITIDVAYRAFTTGASSSSPTRRAMSSTPATWRPAPRPPILP